MRNFKHLMLIAVLSLATLGLAAHVNPKGETVDPVKNQISNQITSLLETNNLKVQGADLLAFVHLTINAKNELVILDVRTESRQLESFVKSRLNYQKIQTMASSYRKFFGFRLRVTKDRIRLRG
ncbi:MAG: hypothetical protein OIF50_05780 [Flavobacteriaceae bacterium]|nr:hypothetical protein [Flavobacteriaceae bacterium]